MLGDWRNRTACPTPDGPYTKESIRQFGISLGNVSIINLMCPLQDAVEILDGLGVSGVSEKLNGGGTTDSNTARPMDSSRMG